MEIPGPVHADHCGHKQEEYVGSITVIERKEDTTFTFTDVDVYVYGRNQAMCLRFGEHGDYLGTTIRSVVGYEPQCAITKQGLRYLAERGGFAFVQTAVEKTFG
jgi:hypothetical protein